LLYAEIGRREHLDRVVVNSGGDAAPLLLLCPYEVGKQRLAVAVRGLPDIKAQCQDKLGALGVRDVPDADDVRRAPLGLYRDHVDGRRKLPQVAAAADQAQVADGTSCMAALARTTGQWYRLAGEERMDRFTLQLMPAITEEFFGVFVGVLDPSG